MACNGLRAVSGLLSRPVCLARSSRPLSSTAGGADECIPQLCDVMDEPQQKVSMSQDAPVEPGMSPETRLTLLSEPTARLF